MAIQRNASQKEEELSLIFDNGDFQALKETATRLGFKDEESMLRYALAVLKQSATRSVTITNQSGEKINLSPSEGLLRPEEPSTSV